MDESRMEFAGLVSQWSSRVLQLRLVENPLRDFISSLFLFIEHLYSVSSNKSIQASKDFPWLQTQMEFCLSLQSPMLKKKTLLKKIESCHDLSLKMQNDTVGKNPVCSTEARSKSGCQSGSGWGVKAGRLSTTMWDGICVHAKYLDGRFLDTMTHKSLSMVSARRRGGWLVYQTLKINRHLIPRTTNYNCTLLLRVLSRKQNSGCSKIFLFVFCFITINYFHTFVWPDGAHLINIHINYMTRQYVSVHSNSPAGE